MTKKKKKVEKEKENKKKEKIPDQKNWKKAKRENSQSKIERKQKGKKIPDQRSKENRRNMQKGLWTRQHLNNTELSPSKQTNQTIQHKHTSKPKNHNNSTS